MSSNLLFTYYKTLILSMKVARFQGKIIVAKPIFFLSIIENIENGKIIGNRINYSDELKETYNSLYKIYTNTRLTPMVYPYYYMKNELFYHIKGDTNRRTPSEKFLRDHVEYAALDDELWDLLHDAEKREEFKQSIIAHFLQ